MALPSPEFEVIELDEHELPCVVGVRIYFAHGVADYHTLRVGDRFRQRGGHMIATITSFYPDGSSAHVKRSTSRRKQAIKSDRLATQYDYIGGS